MSFVKVGKFRPTLSEGFKKLSKLLGEAVAQQKSSVEAPDAAPLHTTINVVLDPSKPPISIRNNKDLRNFDQDYFDEYPMISSVTLVDEAVPPEDALAYRVSVVADKEAALEQKHADMKAAWNEYVDSLFV